MKPVPIPGIISLLLNDRESGSIALLKRLIAALEEELHGPDLNAEAFGNLLLHIREKLNHFAAIENFLASLILHAGQKDASPGEEGKISHERMLQMKLRADLFDEANITEALVQSDLVLMACDAILATEFLNKTGIRAILDQARKLRKRSFLVTESRKKITRPDWQQEWTEQALFEWVPLNLIDGIVTENGSLQE